ncbi:tryptophan synthase subunit alpha [Thermosynechococcus sp. PP45]|nr:tryptophan synthase subunit alpha [Thermosynechococcus sp. PP45]WNC23830.1 tryptophan synthase subunit alpha [Thermosynechococcus sp. PP551]WNC26406.1 tryptophan synthase subunit alpha [Thermosynechococcus sp. PP555]
MTVPTISERFEQCRARQRCALIPFLTAGDPDLETTVAALKALDAHGADLIELGMPYSDPLADGPVIQAAATRALQRGTRLEAVLEMTTDLHCQLRAPLILFTYYNPIYHRGVSSFLKAVAQAGIKGLVIPDLPLEEAEPVLAETAHLGLELTLLIAPTTSPERMQAIATASQGFIYLVSTTGVTGMRQKMATRVQELLGTLRQITPKPIGVGFGIASPEHARQVRDWGADAAIVGSAFVKRLAEPEQGVAAVAEFCQSLRTALDTP